MPKNIDTGKFKTMLELQMGSILQSIEQETASMRTSDEFSPDLLDAAAKSVSRENSADWIIHLVEQKILVEEALRRIEFGTFGICPRCGNEIDTERLLAKPYARYCVQCREKVEQRRIS